MVAAGAQPGSGDWENAGGTATRWHYSATSMPSTWAPACCQRPIACMANRRRSPTHAQLQLSPDDRRRGRRAEPPARRWPLHGPAALKGVRQIEPCSPPHCLVRPRSHSNSGSFSWSKGWHCGRGRREASRAERDAADSVLSLRDEMQARDHGACLLVRSSDAPVSWADARPSRACRLAAPAPGRGRCLQRGGRARGRQVHTSVQVQGGGTRAGCTLCRETAAERRRAADARPTPLSPLAPAARTGAVPAQHTQRALGPPGLSHPG